MEQKHFFRISKREQLHTYQEKTFEKVGVELPMDYLSRARVLALSDRQGRMCAGFTMAHQGPLRCLTQIPEFLRSQNPMISKYEDHCFEINGLWIDHKQAPEGTSFHLYMRCMQEALSLSFQGKHKYVYAYSANNHKLRQFYQNFRSRKLYEGPVRMMPGMNKQEDEVVEMGCMKRLPWTVMRNPGFLISRGLGGRRRSLPQVKEA